jgi:hypothetical protein
MGASRRARAAPIVVSMSPAFGSTAGDTVPHVLTGTGFTGASSVTIGGAAATYTVDSDSQITITATPARTAGLHDVVVTRSGLTGTLAAGYEAMAIGLWLVSDLGITLNGSTVSAWADQSGNGRNATQGNASLQPTRNASARHGVGVQFPTSRNRCLDTSYVPATGAGARTLIMLISDVTNSAAAFDNLASYGSRSASALYSITCRTSSADVLGSAFWGPGLSTSAQGSGTTGRVISAFYNGTAQSIEVDGVGVGSGNFTLATGSDYGLKIGAIANVGAGECAAFTAYDIIVCGSLLDATQRAKIVAHMRAKRGIT